jgi:hypothetical protein
MENAKPAEGRYRSGNGRECVCLVGERLVFVQYADGSYNALNFDLFRRSGFTPAEAENSHSGSPV